MGARPPCQRLVAATSLVPVESLGVLFRSCCRAGTCLRAEPGALRSVKGTFRAKRWWGLGCPCSSQSSSSKRLRSPGLLRA